MMMMSKAIGIPVDGGPPKGGHYVLERAERQHLLPVDVPQLAEEQAAEARERIRAFGNGPAFRAKRRHLLEEIEHLNPDDARGDPSRGSVLISRHVPLQNPRKKRGRVFPFVASRI